MRKICLINQDNDTKLSYNIFSRVAREGKRVLIIDLREFKIDVEKRSRDVGLNIFNCVNDMDDFRKYIISLEQNLDVIYGNFNLNFQEFNLFYDLCKYEYFDKKLKNLDYDYIILEVSASLNLLTSNSVFYSTEIMAILSDEKQGHDFANKLSRFLYNFNNIYGKGLFISKFFPLFKKSVDEKVYTYLVSEFTSKIVSFPIIDVRNDEFGETLDRIGVSIIDNEKYFDTRYNSKEKQKVIKEYIKIVNEASADEVPLTKFNF